MRKPEDGEVIVLTQYDRPVRVFSTRELMREWLAEQGLGAQYLYRATIVKFNIPEWGSR